MEQEKGGRWSPVGVFIRKLAKYQINCTPWEKETFEKQSRAFQAERKKLIAEGKPPEALDELFRRVQAAETKLLSGMAHSGKVGAFEGASYEAKGLYRPAADCIMFTRDDVGFCPVCRRAIGRVIDREAR